MNVKCVVRTTRLVSPYMQMNERNALNICTELCIFYYRTTRFNLLINSCVSFSHEFNNAQLQRCAINTYRQKKNYYLFNSHPRENVSKVFFDLLFRRK